MNENLQRKMPNTRKYLVVGAAGSGKSTLERIFNNKGYQTNDIDSSFGEWRNIDTNKTVNYNPNGGKIWLKKHIWCLNIPKLTKRLAERFDGPLIIFGTTSDIQKSFSLFDKVLLLKYDNDDQVRERINSRTDNLYGKHPDEMSLLLSRYKVLQEEYRINDAIPIDCNQSVEEIVEIIENEIHDH